MLDLWQQLTTSSPNVLRRDNNTNPAPTKEKGGKNAGGSGGGPVDDFVQMEYEQSGELCALVDASLSALKKVSN